MDLASQVVRKALIISPAGEVYNRDSVQWYPVQPEKFRTEVVSKYFNIGDMMVFDSLLKVLGYDEYEPLEIVNPSENDISRYGQAEAIFVRPSNFIHNAMQWHRAVEVIERTRLPVYAIGVGGQASHSDVYQLDDHNLRFWKAVSERSAVIGVRGTFTADLLYRNGIKNIAVCGCPSIFRSRRRDLVIGLPSRVNRVAVSLRREVDATYTPNVSNYINLQRSFLLQLHSLYDIKVTIHGEPEEKAFFYKDEELMQIATRKLICSGWITPDTARMLDIIYRNKLFFFLRASDYDEFIVRNDLAIGYRVHGVLPALANGVPGILVRYDSRSSELADTHAIPSFTPEEISETPPAELFGRADFSDFNRVYRAKYDILRALLESNGILHRL